MSSKSNYIFFAGYSDFIPFVCAALAVLLCIIAIVLLVWRNKKYGHRKTCFLGVRSRSHLNREITNRPTQRIYSGNTSKLTSHQQGCPKTKILVDVNQLQGNCSSKNLSSTDLSVTVSAATQKLAVAIGSKRMSADSNLLVNGLDARNSYNGRPLHSKKNMASSSHSSSSRLGRLDEIKNINQKRSEDTELQTHLVSVMTGNGWDRPNHEPSYYASTSRVASNYPNPVDSNSALDACQDDDCVCDVTSSQFRENNSVDEYSECEEVAMLMCQEEKQITKPDYRKPPRKKQKSTPNAHQQHFAHQHPDSESVFAECDPLLSDSEAGANRPRASPCCLTTKPPSDVMLPSYESVVSSSGASTRNNLSSPCDCGCHSTSSCRVVVDPQQDLSSPPPSYSRHKSRTPSRIHSIYSNSASTSDQVHRSNTHEPLISSHDGSDETVTSSSYDDSSSAELLTNRNMKSYELSV